MSDFTANTSFATVPQQGSMTVLRKFFVGIANGMAAHRAYLELNAKSDSQLAALGLTREDVARTSAKPIFG